MKNYSILDTKSQEQTEKSVSQKNEIKKEFYAYTPSWTMEEVVLRDSVRDSLEDVIAFCTNKEKIIKQWHFERFLKGNGTICINIYGEPGTGKTTAANAVVNAIGCKAIEVSLAEILGSLQGQTEQNLTALFNYAQTNNCIIIFNDADSLLTQRSVGSANSESSNVSKDHLLNLLDSTNVTIIFTTNFMKSYDDAFKSRIMFNIGVPLPNEEERVALWKFHLDTNVPKEISYEELSKLSEGLSGRNIRQLTMTMCIKLTVGKIKSINKEVVAKEVQKIKEAILSSSENSKSIKIEEKDLPKSVKDSLAN